MLKRKESSYTTLFFCAVNHARYVYLGGAGLNSRDKEKSKQEMIIFDYTFCRSYELKGLFDVTYRIRVKV